MALASHRRVAWSSRALCCIVILACSACGLARPSTTFTNPLITVDGADPWLLTYNGNYYLTTTQWSAIRMWKSPTIAGLATARPVTLWSDQDPSRCCNVWAPEFHLLDGPSGRRWYIYYTAGTDGTLDNQRTNVLESAGADPLGPYTYKGRIFDPQHDTWAIDGSVLKMANGALFFLFSAFEGPDQSIFIAPMSNPWTISGPRVLLSTPTYPWEQSVKPVNEGPEALQHAGKTFVVYSASACWGPDYQLGMLEYTGGDVLNTASWHKSPQPVFARDDANGVYAPGHNGFFTSLDGKENWIVYHANSSASDGCTGTRTTRVQKFTWNADGTPNFGVPVSLDAALSPPSGESAATAQPPTEVFYSLVAKAGDQCLAVPDRSAGGTSIGLSTCATSPNQQWSVAYLGNGYYRIGNRANGQVLEAAGGPTAVQDGGRVDQSSWIHTTNQEWRFVAATDGWLRIEARHSGKDLDAGTCGTDQSAGMVQRSALETPCQQFRLQPVDPVVIINANSTKAIVADPSTTGSAAPIVLASWSGSNVARWSFAHQDSGYYQIKASQSGKCLAAADASGVAGTQLQAVNCAGGANQQWRIEPLNDGTVRLVARPSSVVLDVVNCQMADGTDLQQWNWLNNPCQRFRFESR